MSPRQYLPHLLNGLIVIGLLIGGMVVYPSLPSRFPLHINDAGIPDLYSGKSFVLWFRTFTPGIGAMGLLYVASSLLTLFPGAAALLIGITGKNRRQFFALASSQQQGLLLPLRTVFYRLAMLVGAWTGIHLMMTYVVAHGGPGFPFVMLRYLVLVAGLLFAIEPVWHSDRGQTTPLVPLTG